MPLVLVNLKSVFEYIPQLCRRRDLVLENLTARKEKQPAQSPQPVEIALYELTGAGMDDRVTQSLIHPYTEERLQGDVCLLFELSSVSSCAA